MILDVTVWDALFPVVGFMIGYIMGRFGK